MQAEEPVRLSRRKRLLVTGLCVGLCVLTGIGIRLFWNDAKVINFLAAWIPTVGSVIIAFVPESNMTAVRKWIWRTSVILIGVAWSAVLWHQQVIAESTTKQDQTAIVTDAVSKSNAHADEQIGHVREDVGKVQKVLGDSASKKDLSATATAITGIVSKYQSETSHEIKSLAPAPPEIAKLEFSLFKVDIQTSKFPMLTDSVQANDDGSYTVEVFFKNSAEHQAVENGDIWIIICDQCSFASEPDGMDRPSGMAEFMRHKAIHWLNPNTAMEKTILRLKSSLNPPCRLPIAFKYACKVCDPKGATTLQTVMVLALPKEATATANLAIPGEP